MTRTFPQKGFALPLALFAFMITAIIATASVRLGLLDQALARNQSDTMRAKQHAELTINDAIDHVLCVKNTGNTDIINHDFFTGRDPLQIAAKECINGLCGSNDDVNAPLWENLAQRKPSTGWSAAYGDYTGQDKIRRDLGHYIIESVQANIYTGTGSVNNNGNGGEYQYRITAVGFGNSNSQIYRTIQVLFRTKGQRCSYNPQQSTKSAFL
jgi:Tfp pilus assembly protein PilX